MSHIAHCTALATLPPFVLARLPWHPHEYCKLARSDVTMCSCFLLRHSTQTAMAYLRHFLRTSGRMVVAPHRECPDRRAGRGNDFNRYIGVDRGYRILRDSAGRLRYCRIPPDIAALFVADTEGRVAEWRTSRHVAVLPDVDTVLAWAWDIARPRGACDGGVAWARPVAVAHCAACAYRAVHNRRTSEREVRAIKEAINWSRVPFGYCHLFH